MLECDVAVIGAGPGGYVAAIRAAQLGAKTIVVEQKELGGVCLNWGCIPSKTLIYTAELYRKLQRATDSGLVVEGVGLDLKALVKRKDAVVKRNKGGIEALFKAHGIQVLRATGRIVEPGLIRAGEEEIRAKAIIIATGSSPAPLAGVPLSRDGKRILTSTEALDLTEVPKRAAVIGAGAVGAEFACLWNAFGSKVTLIEMLPRILPNEDEEISELLRVSLKKKGVEVRTETTVKKAEVSEGGVALELEGAQAGSLEADVVLVAVGRKYHSEVVTHTEGLGVQVDGRGAILVDEHMETSVKGIFAIGDVVGRTLLAHGASAEGLVAAANATGGHRKMDYRVVPTCTFTSPEVARVGMTEAAAREAGISVKVGRFRFLANGRAATMGETEGMVKIVGDAGTDEVIGVHIMGAEAGELIAAAALAMTLEATVEDIEHTIHTHPTLAEAMLEAAEDYFGRGIHTPPKRRSATPA